MFLSIKFADSNPNSILNLSCKSSWYVVQTLPKASITNFFRIILYKLITSNITISVCWSTSFGHLINKFYLSQIKLLVWFKKDFNSISIRRLSFWVEHLEPPIIDLTLTLFDSKFPMVSLLRMLFADSKKNFKHPIRITDIGLFIISKYLFSYYKILYHLGHLRRLLCIFLLMQQSSFLKFISTKLVIQVFLFW